MTHSEQLFERAKQLIPGGVNSPVRAFRSVGGTPFFVTAANGAMLTTADGRELIDFVGTWGPAIHGHNHPAIKAGSGALTHGYPDSAGVPASFAQETIVLPFNDTAPLEAAFAANPGQIACVILEPYPANVGLILPEPGFLSYLRALCTAHGALLIFDEVMTGFRLARGGVQEIEKITPDLTTLGKIIGGGLPVGAFGGRADVMDFLAPLGPVYQAGTLSGNPLAMVAGIAALKLLDETNPYARLDRLGREVQGALLAAARKKGLPLQVPQVGSMFAVFFTTTPVRDYASALASDAKLFARFFHSCLDRRVYLPPSAYETAFLSTAHEGAVVARACQIMTDAIAAL